MQNGEQSLENSSASAHILPPFTQLLPWHMPRSVKGTLSAPSHGCPPTVCPCTQAAGCRHRYCLGVKGAVVPAWLPATL